MGSQVPPHATVGILSIGDMGLGIARLLLAHGYRVVSNVSDRSPATQTRAKENKIELVDDDVKLVETCDYIFSIVPPRDAEAIASRVARAAASAKSRSAASRERPLYFLDLNAISPATARRISSMLSSISAEVKYVDGGIIGGPPKLTPKPKQKSSSSSSSSFSKDEDAGAKAEVDKEEKEEEWTRPDIPVSGPVRLDDNNQAPSGTHLMTTLNITHISSTIGAATGLKMCFASLSKGFTALAIQSFTTAHNLGVLPELKAQLELHNPHALEHAERGLPEMCPKAYRWVKEMEEIADTFEVDGGFERETECVFRGIAGVYGLVADGTVLGEEVVGRRFRGKSADEVAFYVGEGIRRRKEKVE